ncbi:hypothetical protein NX059_006322 [Plenodomus lindquistii]|nr:hypothetical protein NX059_006322 [Plenodomus lindquistii]
MSDERQSPKIDQTYFTSSWQSARTAVASRQSHDEEGQTQTHNDDRVDTTSERTMMLSGTHQRGQEASYGSIATQDEGTSYGSRSTNLTIHPEQGPWGFFEEVHGSDGLHEYAEQYSRFSDLPLFHWEDDNHKEPDYSRLLHSPSYTCSPQGDAGLEGYVEHPGSSETLHDQPWSPLSRRNASMSRKVGMHDRSSLMYQPPVNFPSLSSPEFVMDSRIPLLNLSEDEPWYISRMGSRGPKGTSPVTAIEAFNPYGTSGLTEDLSAHEIGGSQPSHSDNLSIVPSSSTERALSQNSMSENSISACHVCNTDFQGAYRKGNLARHVRLKHSRGSNQAILACEDCGRLFKRADARLKHMRKHHPHRVEPGTLISRTLRSNEQSTEPDSLQVTVESSQYICEEPNCSKQFARRADLLRHQRIHQDESERPHKCLTCDQAFLYPKDLLRHEATHEGASKPMHFCTVPTCSSGPGGSGFSRLDNLQRHMRKSHSDLT